jgi:threonylcarbamoyladenosine tRNA methylthiotransferase MtaB
MPTVSLYTLGCRLNQAETAIIAEDLRSKGYEIVPYGQPSDLTVINTCTVTEQADSKCRQAVRQSVRRNPDTYVAVVGCYSQMAVDVIRRIKGVDLIVGNEHKLHLSSYLDDLQKKESPKIVHSAKISKEEFIIDSVGLYETHTRANLKIQDGCSFVCSFCIVAAARGPARSRKFDDVMREARKLVEMGFKEIVLTGVNIGTYKQGDKDFSDILSELEKIDGLRRIRISSIEPTTVDKRLIDMMADSSKICRYLHIPLQSGDDEILTAMRRKHSAAQFAEIINYALKKIPDIGIGTDIMVGFPGEDEDKFKNTKRLITELPLAYFHIFSYSDRKGTSAYNYKPKVDYHVKKARNRLMIELGERKKIAFYNQFLGKEIDVLFEERDDAGYWSGFSDNYLRVRVKNHLNLKNSIKKVRLLRIESGDILGELA